MSNPAIIHRGLTLYMWWSQITTILLHVTSCYFKVERFAGMGAEGKYKENNKKKLVGD